MPARESPPAAWRRSADCSWKNVTTQKIPNAALLSQKDTSPFQVSGPFMNTAAR